MRSVRPGVRESRGCAVLAVLASDQREALGASLLAPKAPRPSPGPEGLLLSARGLSRRDCKSPFFVFYKGRLAGWFAPGSGRVVVVGPCGLGFRPERGPWGLSPGPEGSSPVLQPKVFCFLSKGPGVDQQAKGSAGQPVASPHDPCLFRQGLPNQTTAYGKASCTHEDPSRRGGLAQPEAANGPWKKQFFL